MAYFAEIDETSVVTRVLAVPNREQDRGADFLSLDLGLGGNWVQTSYNSRAGKRVDPRTQEVIGDNHLRFNYAAPGFTYDATRDAFIPPKPHPDATLDEQTCLWVIPFEVLIDAGIPSDLTE